MRHSGRPALLEKVFSETIPMRGRMIHGKTKSGELYEQAQDYDIHGRVCFLIIVSYYNSDMLFRQSSPSTEVDLTKPSWMNSNPYQMSNSSSTTNSPAPISKTTKPGSKSPTQNHQNPHSMPALKRSRKISTCSLEPMAHIQLRDII